MGKGQRHRERESKQISRSLLTVSAQPNAGLRLTALGSRPEPKLKVGSSTKRTSQAPLDVIDLKTLR